MTRKSFSYGGSSLKANFTEDFDLLTNFYQMAEQTFRFKVYQILARLTERVTMNTAVWEGETLVNWKWSGGAPDITHRDPVDNGPPGRTNGMALGSEPRRGPNTAPVWQSLDRLMALKQLPDRIFLTNTGTVAMEMEYGRVPTEATSRTRNGVLRLAVAQVAILKG